jgi:hypothetical protein
VALCGRKQGSYDILVEYPVEEEENDVRHFFFYVTPVAAHCDVIVQQRFCRLGVRAAA